MDENYRTNPAVRFSWEPGADGLVATAGGEGLTRSTLEDPEVLAALEFALEPRSRAALLEELRDGPAGSGESAEELLASLLDRDLLLTDADRAGDYRRWIEHGWDESLLFHLATRDWSIEERGTASGTGDTHDAGESDATGGDVDVPLPDPGPLPDRPVEEVMLDRRTCREFDGSPVGADDLASILSHATEPVRRARRGDGPAGQGDEGAEDYFDTASFPVGIYPVVVRSPDLDRGVYRYRPADHGLERRATLDRPAGEVDDRLQEITFNQPWVRDAGVVVLLTVDLAAYRQRYRGSAAFRRLCTVVSAHAHRLLLVATAYGFDVFQAAALQESQADDLVGVDGYDETVFYVVPVGRGDEDD